MEYSLNNEKKEFSRRLKYYCTTHNKTGYQLAEEIGVSSAAVSSWMTGKKMPTLTKIRQICEILGIDYSVLIDLSQEAEINENDLYGKKKMVLDMLGDIDSEEELDKILDIIAIMRR